MFKKAFLGVALVSSFLIPNPATALPKSLTMTVDMVANNAGKKVTTNAKIWYLDMKLRSEVKSNLNFQGNTASPVKVNNKAVIIMDAKTQTAYMLESGTKTALKVDSSQLQKLSGGNSGGTNANFMDPSLFTDTAKMKAALKKEGAKVVGKATLLNRKCTIWEIKKNNVKVPMPKGTTTENVRLKMWLADDISVPLKAEVYSNKRGLVASLKTTSLQVDVPISASLFKVPSGYKVTNMMEMFKTPGR